MNVLTEKTSIQVSFPKEKLDALKFYMDEKDTTVEKELQAHIINVYEKYVPAATRRYLDRHDAPEVDEPEVAIDSSEQSTDSTVQSTPSKGRKKSLKVQDQDQQEPKVVNETDALTEQAEEETLGMSMSM